MNNDLTKILRSVGFKSMATFKVYMKSKAKLNEYGAICFTEKRQGFELNYSDNCKCQYGIGGNNRGIFSDYRFN